MHEIRLATGHSGKPFSFDLQPSLFQQTAQQRGGLRLGEHRIFEDRALGDTPRRLALVVLEIEPGTGGDE
jgi:hypothetical protein